MFAAVIREGEVVLSPTGRQWVVTGWAEQRRKVSLRDPANGEECELSPRLLRHASSKYAGQSLEEI